MNRARTHAFEGLTLYDLFANVFFLSRRRATFKALIDAAGVVAVKPAAERGGACHG